MPIPRKQTPACPVELALTAIAARWKAMILYRFFARQTLQTNSARVSYGQLRAEVAGITERVLSTQMREMLADGLLTKERSGRQVWYRLTAAGQELEPIFEALWVWGASRQQEAAGLPAGTSGLGITSDRPAV